MQPPAFISPITRYCRFWPTLSEGQTLATQSTTANRIFYYPIVIPWYYPIKRFWVYNSSVAGNWDVGIYSREGARIVNTGSVAQAVTSVMQYTSLSYLLSPGSYYLALQFSAAGGGTQLMSFFNAGVKSLGLLQQSPGSFGLPAAATFEVAADSFLRIFGFTLTESGF